VIGLLDRYRSLANPLKTERSVELCLLVVVALFIVLLLVGGLRGLLFSGPEPVYPREASLAVQPITPAPQLTAEQRNQISGRPLFWSSRKPLDAAVSEELAGSGTGPGEPGAPGKIAGTKLAGVFGGGETAGIIVISRGKERRLIVGEELEGWTLKAVRPTEAVFAGDGEETTLALAREKLIVSAPQQEATTEQPRKTEKADADNRTSANNTVQPDKQQSDDKRPNNKKQPNKKQRKASDGLSLGGRG